MNILTILLGTAILWVLNTVLVMPIARALTKARANQTQASAASADGTVASVPGVATASYILVDVIVLGIAGFLFGRILGWFFFGIAWEAKSWPGVIAFILASILGAAMY